MQQLLSLTNPVLRSFLFYATILISKMLIMALLTVRLRISKKISSNPEDTKMIGSKISFSDPDVERVRRAHLNDIENIPQFLFISVIYILTDPSAFIAINFFRIYTIFRCFHTYVYVIHVMPQPTRGIACIVTFFIQWYMVFNSVTTFYSNYAME